MILTGSYSERLLWSDLRSTSHLTWVQCNATSSHKFILSSGCFCLCTVVPLQLRLHPEVDHWRTGYFFFLDFCFSGVSFQPSQTELCAFFWHFIEPQLWTFFSASFSIQVPSPMMPFCTSFNILPGFQTSSPLRDIITCILDLILKCF